jgi:hypothetical protein
MDKQTGPTNRVGGDFDYVTLEAFRSAYAQQLNSPNEDSVANNSGLPTNTISNTSPWFEHIGASWRYPSGRGPDGDLKQPFNPDEYLSDEVLDGDGEIEELTDEEVEQLVNEITGSPSDGEEGEE